nr:PHP domain-containing protein [Lentilactobacillus otakiensis]
MSYVPLQVISSYSLLQSPIRIAELISEAKDRGYQALALTDLNVMYGAVEFYDACLSAGIKPLIGLTLQLPGLILTDKNYSLVLLAKNQQGYANLLKLSTLKMTLPELTVSQLTDYLSDLFVILPPLGEMNDLLLQGRSEDSVALIDQLKSLGVDRNSLKIGVDYHSSDSVIDMLSKLAADQQVALVADSPVDYINATDYFPMQVLKKILLPGPKSLTLTNLANKSAHIGCGRQPRLNKSIDKFTWPIH